MVVRPSVMELLRSRSCYGHGKMLPATADITVLVSDLRRSLRLLDALLLANLNPGVRELKWQRFPCT